VQTLCGVVRFMDAGLGSTALDLLQHPSTSGRVVLAVCKALRSVTTADDERRPSSKAFPNARLLGQNKSMAVFMALLAKFADEDAEVAAAVLLTLRQLAANDEICKEFADVGGISKSLQLLHQQMDNRTMVTACCSALRQLANSDDVKKAIVEADGLELLLRSGPHVLPCCKWCTCIVPWRRWAGRCWCRLVATRVPGGCCGGPCLARGAYPIQTATRIVRTRAATHPCVAHACTVPRGATEAASAMGAG
jgi:hypothetical protein